MRKRQLARYSVLGLLLLLSSLSIQAQQMTGQVTVSQVPQQEGWFDIQFRDGDNPYALKAMMAGSESKGAVIQRLYVDEVKHVARIGAIDHKLTVETLQALMNEKLIPVKTPNLNALNQPIE